MKIAIIGYSGCGKSTLAIRIGVMNNIHVLHMDQVHWLPDWKEREQEAECHLLKEFLDGHHDWVIDGNYSHILYHERMDAADQIFFLNFPRLRCLIRAIRRYYENKGKTRDSMTEGCNEKIDWAFIRWILYDGRTKKTKKQYQALIHLYPDKVIEIKNQKQLDDLIQTYIQKHD